jgi:protein tyrosine phosphatase (PTP) superfamily phosphohydrolase (DUF442 family)
MRAQGRNMMAAESILNFVRVDERTALAGQPSESQLQSLGEEGYEVVINLAPAQEGAPADERTILEAANIDYHHIPVPWAAPEASHLEEFFRVMDGSGERPKLIHCAANFRVTAFYSLYAMKRLGWSKNQADGLIAQVWESRPDHRMDDVWKTFIAQARERLAIG